MKDINWVKPYADNCVNDKSLTADEFGRPPTGEDKVTGLSLL